MNTAFFVMFSDENTVPQILIENFLQTKTLSFNKIITF